MSLLGTSRGKKGQGLKSLLCTFLVMIYLTSASQFELLHEFLHSSHHAVSHSDAQENDPCHRAIYHLDVGKGCSDHAHIVVTDKCELCDIIFHTDQVLLCGSESRSPKFFSLDFVLRSSALISPGAPILPSRAPPAI